MAIKHPVEESFDEYICDFETANSSFVALAGLLYRKGIKNYSFFLKLYDTDLVGVDPFDPKLSLEMKTKVTIECRRNFWYFLRECVRIPKAGKCSAFILNRGNLAAAWSLYHGFNTYLVMPRQFGKTIVAACFNLWIFNFGATYTKILFMHKSLEGSEDNLDTLKKLRDLLPDYLQLKYIVDEHNTLKEARNNVRTIRNNLDNEIITKASARSEFQADMLGRGMTLPIIWFDEFAFLMFNETIWAAAISVSPSKKRFLEANLVNCWKPLKSLCLYNTYIGAKAETNKGMIYGDSKPTYQYNGQSAA